jgi:hypothetical protein
MTEAAVMLAFALHLFNRGASKVELHPDGEHAKRFDIKRWLEDEGFSHARGVSKVKCCGTYTRKGCQAEVSCNAGKGDVVAAIGDQTVIAECKGGIVNTTHPGQTSRLRKGLCESVGQLLSRPLSSERHVAVVPHTPVTARLAEKMRDRAAKAGIEIALVQADGSILFAGSK